MAAKKIIVGCRLPNGILLHHPQKPEITVELNGLNKQVIVGAGYATTEVDADFWADWKAAHGKYAPLAGGSIFAVNSEADAKVAAKDLAALKTGFEKMPRESGGVKKVTDDEK